MVNLIEEIKVYAGKENSKFWKKVVKELEAPTRSRRNVSLDKLNKITKEGETVLVLADVLGSGILTHDLTVAAIRFSAKADEKVKNKMTIKELFKKNPKAKDVRIIK